METDSLTVLKAAMIGELTDFAGPAGFHQVEKYRQAPPDAVPFSTCSVDGLKIAVFIERPVPEETLALLASHKPVTIDALVYVQVVTDAFAEEPVIEGRILVRVDAAVQACAFASACAAFSLGLFQVIPESYRVTFADQPTVRVSMDFDDDTESWFGEAAIEL